MPSNKSFFVYSSESLSTYGRRFKRYKDSSRNSHKHFPGRILLAMPLLRDIIEMNEKRDIEFRDKIPTRLLYVLLNPIELLDDTLVFLHFSVNRILEIGLPRGVRTPLPQMFLKGLIGGVIMLLRAPLALIKPIGYILPLFVDNIVNIVLKTVAFIFNEIKSIIDRPVRGNVSKVQAPVLDTQHRGQQENKRELEESQKDNSSSEDQLKDVPSSSLSNLANSPASSSSERAESIIEISQNQSAVQSVSSKRTESFSEPCRKTQNNV